MTKKIELNPIEIVDAILFAINNGWHKEIDAKLYKILDVTRTGDAKVVVEVKE